MQRVDECPVAGLDMFQVEVAADNPARYRGAMFCAVAGQARCCRQALQAAGITKGLVED